MAQVGHKKLWPGILGRTRAVYHSIACVIALAFREPHGRAGPACTYTWPWCLRRAGSNFASFGSIHLRTETVNEICSEAVDEAGERILSGIGSGCETRGVNRKSNYSPVYPHPYELFMLQILQSHVKLSISKHSHDFPELKNCRATSSTRGLSFVFSFCCVFLGW